jgi:hypothetical protein
LFAAQVPSKTVWPVSFISAQEPSAEFGFSGEICAVHAPAKVRFTPAVAVQLPRSSRGASWAEADTVRPSDRIKAAERKTLSRALIGFSSKEIASADGCRTWKAQFQSTCSRCHGHAHRLSKAFGVVKEKM